MKHITKKITKLCSFALLALALFTISCEIPENPEDVIELRLDTNVFTHKGFISVNDLADQNNLNGKVLKGKVTVEGGATRPNILVSEGGNYGDVWDINDGFVAFAVNPQYAGFSEPIVFSLEIYGNDYLTKTVNYTINPEDFITQTSEVVINTKKVPEGVVIKEQTETLTGGSNTESIEVATEASTSGTAAAVSVPAATVFKDDTGASITSGNLTAQVVYFDGNNDAAVRSSSSSSVESLVDESGNTLENVVLSPAASVDVKMFLGSTAVRQFEEPIEVSIDINKDLRNPNTKASVSVGDQLNIYETSDDSNWRFQSKATVISVDGKLVLSFPTDHLTTFLAGFIVNICGDNASAIIELPDGGIGFSSSYEGYFLDVDDNKTPAEANKIGSTLVIDRVPSSLSSLVLESIVAGLPKVVVTAREWCDGGGVTVDEIQGLALPGVTVKVTASAKCSGGSSLTPDKIMISIDRNGNGVYDQVGLTDKGVIYIPGLSLSTEYSIKGTFNGDSAAGPYTFDSTNVVITDFPIPADICDQLGL